ncbi:MAG TPA: peptide-methionine (S)-S-oxide reductase MsrA [Rhodocyclaceae bacterium]
MTTAKLARRAVLVASAIAATAAIGAPEGAPTERSAVFAGGCFWGVEAVFEHVRGVKAAIAGYSGGSADAASYVAVSQGDTGHAESVRVIYDPARVSYESLLEVFFAVAHDPTQLDRQGPDIGSQYRSEVFYADEQQRQAATDYVAGLARSRTFRAPIVTRIEPLRGFYPAEYYHQHYVERHPDNPYVVINDAPKLKLLRAKFPRLYRDAGTE